MSASDGNPDGIGDIARAVRGRARRTGRLVPRAGAAREAADAVDADRVQAEIAVLLDEQPMVPDRATQPAR